MTPAQLLEQARRLCDDTSWERAFWTTRAAVILTRQAMEGWLDEYWEVTSRDVRHVQSTRARFLLLQARLPPPMPARAYATWWRLSEACHHYSHDMPPSPEDVRSWVDEAEEFAAMLRINSAPEGSPLP